MEGGEVEPPYEFVVDAVELLEERDGLKQDEVDQIGMDWYEKRKASQREAAVEVELSFWPLLVLILFYCGLDTKPPESYYP